MFNFLRIVVLYCLVINIVANKTKTNMGAFKFPIMYLSAESLVPTMTDLEHYIYHLKRVVRYFGRDPNSTDINTALSLYFTKALLKRTLVDHQIKIQRCHLQDLLKLINNMEYILSHYTYEVNSYFDWTDFEFRISKLFKFDLSLIYSIGKFNNDRLKSLILNQEPINDFIAEMDDAALAKEEYAKLIDSGLEGHYISIQDSDLCISRVAYTPEPMNPSMIQRCKADAYCEHRLNSKPSIGYTLTHRMLNMLFRVKARSCYMDSPSKDLALMDRLCSSMYREAVYLARRGFFARDIFLEHIALCGLMGYEEFHRHHWFHKASSWLNENGCVKEFRNFELNRTRALLKEAISDERRRFLLRWRSETLASPCDDHPTGIFMIVMAHGIRHAAHYLPATLPISK